jgi:hypothetical protein
MPEPPEDPSRTASVFCHRCGRELTPGRGDFYVVSIEARADPTPPTITDEDLAADPRAELERTVEQLHEQSEREMMDQVCRRLTLHLCGPCYRQWMENPVA